jgi:hypothetical protein
LEDFDALVVVGEEGEVLVGKLVGEMGELVVVDVALADDCVLWVE